MSKRVLAYLIGAVVILLGGIIFGISRLYKHDSGNGEEAPMTHFLERNPILKAIPSDAVVVFCVKNYGRACEYITDSTAVFGELFAKDLVKLMKGSYPSLKKNPAILSVHYSKDLPPLLVIDGQRAAADSTEDFKRLMADVDSARLYSATSGEYILISTSETIVNSSLRHLSQGHSILEASGFSELGAMVEGEDVFMVSNSSAVNLGKAFFTNASSKDVGFIRDLGEWTSFCIKDHSDKGTKIDGKILFNNEPSYYLNVLKNAGVQQINVAEAVPSNTVSVMTLSIGDVNSYLKGYRHFLDTKNKLGTYEDSLSRQKTRFGSNAEDWAVRMDIREVAVVGINFKNGFSHVLLLRNGRKGDPETVEYSYKGFAESLFGGKFKADDESYCCTKNGWTIVGSKECCDEYTQEGFLDENLKSLLSRKSMLNKIPQKNGSFFFYQSLTEDPAKIDGILGKSTAEAVKTSIKNTAFAPLILSISQEKGALSFNLSLERDKDFDDVKTPTAASDTTVRVPEGPFTVKNCATGTDYKIYQNSHLSICFQDENGKDLWGVPFKGKFCGMVEAIDNFKNGKLQYLFASDSKLYLIDRLGRFVNGFPVETGKIIAVGPAVFDFDGNLNYSAMVLNKDNTIGLMSLDGKPKKGWMGISTKETIQSIPELITIGETRYWIVRTSRQLQIFPFNGGDPVVVGQGGKMIRTDSKIEVLDNGKISAKCQDGKVRTIKIDK